MIPFILFELIGGIISNIIYEKILTPIISGLPAYSLIINILAFLTGTILFIAAISIQNALHEYDYREHFEGIDREQVDKINELIQELTSRRSRAVLSNWDFEVEQIIKQIQYYREELLRMEAQMQTRRSRR